LPSPHERGLGEHISFHKKKIGTVLLLLKGDNICGKNNVINKKLFMQAEFFMEEIK